MTMHYVPLNTECPKCHNQMEKKGRVSQSEGVFGIRVMPVMIMQCPECSNIEFVDTEIKELEDG